LKTKISIVDPLSLQVSWSAFSFELGNGDLQNVPGGVEISVPESSPRLAVFAPEKTVDILEFLEINERL
jgi:hypothetical protein